MEKQYKTWLEQKFSKNSTSPYNYIQGLIKFLNKHNIDNAFAISDIDLTEFLYALDSNYRFEKNEKTHLKTFVEFREFDINQFHIFDRKSNEKKTKKTERIAIDEVTKHFLKKNFKIENFEKSNLGWDLEASKDDETLLLEVKGIAKNFNSIFLSENEYKKMIENKETYRICIVSNCSLASSKRKIRIIKFSDNGFCDDGNIKLRLNEKLSAVLFNK